MHEHHAFNTTKELNKCAKLWWCEGSVWPSLKLARVFFFLRKTGKTETHMTGFIGKLGCLGKTRDMWTNEGTFHVTYPGCTGRQSAVHSSWLLPQEPIISLPWHGTSSTAQGCLTEHDIASVCVCQCVCCKGAQTSSYHHLLQTANPQGPLPI